MSVSQCRLARLVGVAVVACALPLSSPSYASAAPDRPDGPDTVRSIQPPGSDQGRWSVHHDDPGSGELVWRSPQQLPLTSARPEFRVGDKVVGYPSVGADGRTLTLDGVDPESAEGFEVWLGSQRLDGPTPQLRVGVPPDVADPDVRKLGIDPAKPGPYDTKEFEYSSKKLPWPAYPGDMEVRGNAVLSKGVDDAPLVLFLHGRHQACYGKDDDGKWPCSGDSKPVPSYLGYRYLQQRLASQGYATVSISANAINQQDYFDADGGARARSKLVRHHLDLLAERSAADGNRWSGRLDLDQVVLVGHSRGGEGVNQAVVDTPSSAPYNIVGQFLIAPTDFAQQTAGYMPTVVALPYCDGDVSDLQGQKFVDASVGLADDDDSLRSSVLVRGANHNFFNTEWTPGISAAPSSDDWFGKNDPTCGPKRSDTRLGAAEQRKVGLVLTTGAVRMFVQSDDRMLKIFDAAGAVATPSMGDFGAMWSHAVGGARTTVAAGRGATIDGAARECLAQSDAKRSCDQGLGGSGARPHWMQPFYGLVGRAVPYEARIGRKSPGTSGGLQLNRPLDVSSDGDTLDLRLISPGTLDRVRVQLRDADGTRWTNPVKVLRLLGRNHVRPYWAQTVRIDPAKAPDDFDTSAVGGVRVTSEGSPGEVWIVDVSDRATGIPEVPDRMLPRLQLGKVTVDEGDGDGVAKVPYRIRGPVDSGSKFDVVVHNPRSRTDGRLVKVDVPAGQHEGTIKVPFVGDKLDDYDQSVYLLTAQAVRDMALGKYVGAARVRDDDPTPKLSVRPKRQAQRAGTALTWKVKLARPVGYTMRPRIRLSDVDGFAPLRGTDVPKRWLKRHGNPKHPKQALSRMGVYLPVKIKAGETKATLRIPTVRRGPDASPKGFKLAWHATNQPPRTVVATVRPAKR